MKRILLLVLATVTILIVYQVFIAKEPVLPEFSGVFVEPTEQINSVPEDIAAAIAAKSDLIVVSNPAPLAQVASPLTISGQARGYWFFEASFPIEVVNWDGLIIGTGYATAEGDWMTEDFVPFTAAVTFTNPYHDGDPDFMSRGTLILKKDNPSDLPEHDDALEIPILFTPAKKATLSTGGGGSPVTIYDDIRVPQHSTKVDLSGRGLTGSLKAEVRQLDAVTELNLSDNQFTGLPAEVGQLTTLKVLNLSNNPLTGLPYELGNLSNLELLDLRGTNYATADLEIIKVTLPNTVQILIQ